jgi:3-methyl-2-oxobutanoate hydroxymethyltransferase
VLATSPTTLQPSVVEHNLEGLRMAKTMSVHDLLAAKGKQTWVQLHVDSADEAAAAVAAGIVILSCEADQRLAAIRAAAPTAFITAGMPHGAAATPDEAVRAAFGTLRQGASSIYTSHSPRFVEAMAREGIPVTGHVGLVPNLAAWTGYRAIGRRADEALTVLRKAKDIENAGAACLEVEVVPVQLAEHITRSTHMITMGMGCGTVCDTQYLFSCDVLGSNRGHYPRHSKRYADFVRLEEELQDKRIAAFRAFVADVESTGYPEKQHEIWMDEDEAEAFAQGLQGL